jgi:hypothetical protein
MAVSSWAPKGSKCHKWLVDHKDNYIAACKKGNLKDWFCELLHLYFETFHWSIPDDTDPEDTVLIINLDNYDKDDPKLQKHLKLQASIYDRKRDVHKPTHNANCLLTGDKQLKLWFYNHYGNPKKLAAATPSATPAPNDLPRAHGLLTDSCSRQKNLKKGPTVARKSHCTEVQVYTSLYYEHKLKPEVDIAFDNAGLKDMGVRRINILNHVGQHFYAEETADVKAKVQQCVKELRDLDAMQNAFVVEDGPPSDPLALKRCDHQKKTPCCQCVCATHTHIQSA